MGNQEKTGGNQPVYASEAAAFARQASLRRSGIYAGVSKTDAGWILLHDPYIERPMLAKED